MLNLPLRYIITYDCAIFVKFLSNLSKNYKESYERLFPTYRVGKS